MPGPAARPVLAHDVPKRGGGTRVMATLEERDARAWEAIGHAARLLGGLALGPEITTERRDRGARRHGLLPALGRARTLSAQLARSAPLLLKTDVARFYPSVTPRAAHAVLRHTGAGRHLAGRAAGMLEAWGSEGYAGLPIGPPASAGVADLVLASADASLRRAGVRFLRWVDDYLVAVADERGARAALERLDDALERLGLERSAPKTRILESRDLGAWPGRASAAGTATPGAATPA